jgi:hypothetical protein
MNLVKRPAPFTSKSPIQMEKLKDITDFLTITISRKEIEARDTSSICATLDRLLEDEETISHFFEKVELGVSGYDNDPRELWDIPEVKAFFLQLDNRFPYWFFFLTKFGSGLKVIAFCCCKLISLSATKVWLEPASLEQFLNRHFLAMNQLCDHVKMSEKENVELTELVVGYFT